MIHPSAFVHPEAQLAPDVKVGPFAVIERDVVIGQGTWIGPNATIMEASRLGANCRVFPTAVIGAISQDLKYAGEYTTVEIGDNTTLREGVTVHRGTADRLKTVIGSNCLLMCYAHVAHDCVLGDNVIVANGTGISGHVCIDNHAIIEGMCGIQQFVHIGSHSFIGGGSMVRKDVPPYVRAARDPLSYIGVNTIGMKRRGFDEETAKEIESIYKTLFVLSKNLSMGVAKVREQYADSERRKEILNFIDTSQNGVIKGSV
jgi:UDP-N-acetylglucosamine acyltransferase